MRKFFDRMERWSIGDPNGLIAVVKMFLIMGSMAMIVLGPFMYLDSKRPSFTLKKAEWNCTLAHRETKIRPVGKMYVPVTVTVCDEYRRK